MKMPPGGSPHRSLTSWNWSCPRRFRRWCRGRLRRPWGKDRSRILPTGTKVCQLPSCKPVQAEIGAHARSTDETWNAERDKIHLTKRCFMAQNAFSCSHLWQLSFQFKVDRTFLPWHSSIQLINTTLPYYKKRNYEIHGPLIGCISVPFTQDIPLLLLFALIPNSIEYDSGSISK